ncbi:MAG: hypothetical protein JXB32_00040 [Deltaproteobacteria bacterium]|nr:hypothetical protein [Deltaproteobacteria bacterium]
MARQDRWWAGAALVCLAAAGCPRSGSGTGSASPRADEGSEAAAGPGSGTARGDPGPGDATAPSTELRLELRTSKTSYAAGEPLAFTAWLVNGDSRPVVVLRRASHVDLGLDAANEAREFITSLLPPEPPEPPTADDLATVPAGGELELADWEMLARVNEQILAGNGRTGHFEVKAYYHAGAGLTENLTTLDPAVWTGSLVSNTVPIDVR